MSNSAECRFPFSCSLPSLPSIRTMIWVALRVDYMYLD